MLRQIHMRIIYEYHQSGLFYLFRVIDCFIIPASGLVLQCACNWVTQTHDGAVVLL